MITRSLALLLAWAGSTGVALAQVHPGTSGFAAYDLRFGGMTIGHLVVVDGESTEHPAGFTAGKEHWTWTDGPRWPGAFTVAVAEQLPDHADHDWQIVDHGEFEAGSAEAMPELAMAPGDRLWVVESPVGSREDFTFGDASYLWLMEGSATEPELSWTWYALSEAVSGETLDPGTEILRFRAAFEPPEPGSVEVVELR